jgi:hypothetical protein
MVCQVIDAVKDNEGFACIIMEKYSRSLKNIIEEYPK